MKIFTKQVYQEIQARLNVPELKTSLGIVQVLIGAQRFQPMNDKDSRTLASQLNLVMITDSSTDKIIPYGQSTALQIYKARVWYFRGLVAGDNPAECMSDDIAEIMDQLYSVEAPTTILTDDAGRELGKILTIKPGEEFKTYDSDTSAYFKDNGYNLTIGWFDVEVQVTAIRETQLGTAYLSLTAETVVSELVDLTAQGHYDWLHPTGSDSLADRKDLLVADRKLSDLSIEVNPISQALYSIFGGGEALFDWTDGLVVPSGSGDATGYMFFSHKAALTDFSGEFVFDAEGSKDERRRLIIYANLNDTRGQIEVSMDGVTTQTLETDNEGTATDVKYIIDFQPAAAGKRVYVRLKGLEYFTGYGSWLAIKAVLLQQFPT